ncbi:MAG: PLP-dependent aminotransferase family protein [Blautia sp.]|nr:PLP-dependent aminotransferase family protein [Blautia sp.]
MNTSLLYMDVYHHFEQLILGGQLPPGAKLPSLRKCCWELHVSRTTVEAAYLQLAADGYIISRPQSGYFVTEIAEVIRQGQKMQKKRPEKAPIRYDFASSGVDRQSFRFDLWQRYLKSALRQNERMLTYGEPQGESDLRETLAAYIRTQRNIYCGADQILIGAGVQSLLQLLCPMLKDRRTVSFPTPSFTQGIAVFTDYGFKVHYRDRDCSIIYVSPAHMTRWGEIMPVKRRMELIRYSEQHGSIVIEDDYENEFVYLQKPTPSLYSLSGSENVVYLGTFSRLLLPSIRISFMILPPSLLSLYQERASHYNQTASKAEQIALCQFIRDGHMASQIRRLNRLYGQKLKLLADEVDRVFGPGCQIRYGAAGITLALTVPCLLTEEELRARMNSSGIRFQILSLSEGSLTLVLSCSSMDTSVYPEALRLLKELLI